MYSLYQTPLYRRSLHFFLLCVFAQRYETVNGCICCSHIILVSIWNAGISHSHSSFGNSIPKKSNLPIIPLLTLFPFTKPFLPLPTT